jgi:glucokinase
MVAGLDVGGTKTNATLLDSNGVFLNNRMVETPSRVLEGPEAAIEAMAKAIELAIDDAGVSRESVRVIGLDTPGPASANGVISSKGSTNFSGKEWRGFDIRTAAEDFFKLPVVYNNDANAAALYAHQCFFGEDSVRHSSVSAIVGTGLGGGVVDNGRVIRGCCGMAGELGHIRISLEDLLQDDQPIPQCNCGLYGDLESIASLTGISKNLLPYWLSKYPNHPLANSESMIAAAKAVRGHAEKGDEMALRIFEQQAKAIGRMFSIAANFTDPDAYFVGGGIVEAEPHFRDWCMDIVRASTELRDEQRQIVQFAVVPDLDMAGARGSALAALQMLRIAAA